LDVLANITRPSRLFDRLLEDSRAQDKLTSYIDVGALGADRVTGQDDPFQKLVRIALDQLPVLKRTWLAFVGITAKVARTLMVLGQESPFHARRKARAATATETGLDDELRHVGGRDLSEHLLESLVAAGLFVLGQRPGVSGLAHVFQ